MNPGSVFSTRETCSSSVPWLLEFQIRFFPQKSPLFSVAWGQPHLSCLPLKHIYMDIKIGSSVLCVFTYMGPQSLHCFMVCLGDLPGVAAQTFPYLLHCCRILQPADATPFALPVSDGHLSCINTSQTHSGIVLYLPLFTGKQAFSRILESGIPGSEMHPAKLPSKMAVSLRELAAL